MLIVCNHHLFADAECSQKFLNACEIGALYGFCLVSGIKRVPAIAN